VLVPVREHVAVAHPPAEADLAALIGHYCALAAAEGHRVGRPGGREAARRLAAETGNLTHLIDLGVRRRRWAEVTGATARLSEHMRLTGADLTGLLDTVLAAVGRHGSDLRTPRLLHARGNVAQEMRMRPSRLTRSRPR
jgi:hypothetical protein